MAAHAQAFDAQTESEAADLPGVITHRGEDRGIDHPCASELDPVSVPIKVDFDARLGKGKERRSEPNVHIPTQVVVCKYSQHRLEIGHRDMGVDIEAFHLMKHRE